DNTPKALSKVEYMIRKSISKCHRAQSSEIEPHVTKGCRFHCAPDGYYDSNGITHEIGL
ncbi:hypothetical protein EVAR_100010_1, partial [Eumeta japonica]